MTKMETPEKRLGKYEILAEIGSGGFGTVYRARDTELDREVALKVLHPELARDPAFVERFRREAEAVSSLQHPHIVTIYEVGEVEGRHYIAMQFLEGESLDKLLARTRGPLRPEQALSILGDVAAALDYAHGRGIVHRDVKPSNIILTDEGAVLGDFGVVRLMGEATRLTTTGQAMGTPEYMAPEQILGRDVGAQTDVYALGVVAYRMLTGQVPYAGTTPFAVQDGHVRGEIPSACAINPSLPGAVDEVLARALAKERQARPASAGEMVAALRSAFPAQVDERPEEIPAEFVEEISQPAPELTAVPTSFTTARFADGVAAAPSRTRVVGGRPRARKGTRRWIAALAGLGCVGVVVLTFLLVAFLIPLFGGLFLSLVERGDGGSTTDSTTPAVTLVNNSGQTICYVYISPTTETTWGQDWLDSTETIANGSSRTFNVSAGAYDMRAEDCSHNALDEEWNVSITGPYTWSVP